MHSIDEHLPFVFELTSNPLVELFSHPVRLPSTRTPNNIPITFFYTNHPLNLQTHQLVVI